MSLIFNTVSFKNDTQQAIKVTEDNFQEISDSINGTIVDGVMSFQISNHKHFVLVGDWLVLFDRGRDILVFTDKMFQRLFKSV
jgi:hypothetical protein